MKWTRPWMRLAPIAAMATVACAPQLPPPAVLAEQTVLDERLVLNAERLYHATATVALAADRAGLVPAPARGRIAAADRRAYAALQAFRAAYAAGNATSYAAAADAARVATETFLQALRS